jgi:hypothetical protein
MARQYRDNTISTQIHRVGRVEEHHGDVDEHYGRDRMVSLIQLLKYSKEDCDLAGPLERGLSFQTSGHGLRRKEHNGKIMICPPSSALIFLRA